MIRAELFMRDAQVLHSPRLIQNPEVSVILPTYCRGNNGLLKRAIESVLAQTLRNFELIIMDDGSMDRTAEVIAGYVKADDRVIHVRHNQNCGLPALRVNEALLMARGEFCAYQFDDDIWTEHLLSVLTDALRKHQTYEVAYGLCRSTYDGFVHILGGPFNYTQLTAGNFIANNAVIHRRSVFERLGGYDMHIVMRRLCDWDLWLRWSRDAAFLSVHDEIVSIVDGGLQESLGKTVALDGYLSRAHMAVERNEKLRPAVLKSYDIDDLHHLGHLGMEKVHSAWRRQIAPFQSRFRQIWTTVRPPSVAQCNVIVTRPHFDCAIDITIGSFAGVLAKEFVFTFVPDGQVDEGIIKDADVLILHHSTAQKARWLEETARKYGTPTVFVIDDGVTSFSTSAALLSQTASEGESVAGASDLVIAYSRQQHAAEFNPRTLTLNVSIEARYLEPAKSRLALRSSPSGEHKPLKVGFSGGERRRKDLDAIWPGILAASRQLGPSVEFHFWGIEPKRIDELKSPVYCDPFVEHDVSRLQFERAFETPHHGVPLAFSYRQYLKRLANAGFDIMLAPVVPEGGTVECGTEFLESTVAGAVGIYSDNETFSAVEQGVTGIKCENTPDAWSAAILKTVSMSLEERTALASNALDVVQQRTAEVQAPLLSGALHAGILHGQLGRSSSGNSRVAYFCHSGHLAGAESNLLRHATLAQSFSFEPILVLPLRFEGDLEEIQRRAMDLGIEIAYLPLTIETEVNPSRELDEEAITRIQCWLIENEISMVHSVTLMREVGEAAGRAAVPHVASLYATASEARAEFRHCNVIHSDSFYAANRWAEVLGAPVRRVMSYVPEEYFEMYNAAGVPRTEGLPLRVAVFGSLQPRKGQLAAVEAVGLLRQADLEVELRLIGYNHFYPEYTEACRREAESSGVSDRVRILGFMTDHAAALRDVHIVLCCSDWESLPLTVLEAMAAGRLVIAPNVGGIPEVVSHRTGILAPDNKAQSICDALRTALRLTSEEWRKRTSLAHEVLLRECSSDVVSGELLKLYREAVLDSQNRLGGKRTTVQDSAAWRTSASENLDGAILQLDSLRRRIHDLGAKISVPQ